MHGGSMDQELIQYLDERFNRVDQRFDRKFEDMSVLFRAVSS
mgnify:CR=1 FL=1